MVTKRATKLQRQYRNKNVLKNLLTNHSNGGDWFRLLVEGDLLTQIPKQTACLQLNGISRVEIGSVVLLDFKILYKNGLI